ncbi:response regulator [Fidelibacter multiformis]|jgi:CheY-like chemotaxis protein|uniref:response regulator n=1 Tax=Fidelibacter multiformis TaxID=3377529 RepID=UPI0037DD9667
MKKIVIVEDERIIADDLQLTLKSWGYDEVITVTAAEDLLEHLDEIKPDLILMDIMLRGKMNGIEAVHIINKKKPIPVIYITAYANKATIDKATETNPLGYLIKPFEEYRLKEIIESAFK